MKGKIGLIKCRLASPQALMDCTKPTQLILTFNKKTEKFHVEPLKEVEPRKWNYNLGNYYCPLNYTDKRVIAWELERKPCDFSKYKDFFDIKGKNNISDLLKFDLKENINGRIVSYSPTISNLLSCNTALYPLGSAEQAKAICYYMFDYLLKDTVQKVNTLTSGLAALNKLNIRKKEIADGLREPQEDGLKYFFNVFLNQINNSMEFSATMASSLLLGLSSVKISHEFWLVYITSATNLVMNNYNKKQLLNETKEKKAKVKPTSTVNNSSLMIDTEDLLLDSNNKIKCKLSTFRYKNKTSLNSVNDQQDLNDERKADDNESIYQSVGIQQQNFSSPSSGHLDKKVS